MPRKAPMSLAVSEIRPLRTGSAEMSAAFVDGTGTAASNAPAGLNTTPRVEPG